MDINTAQFEALRQLYSDAIKEFSTAIDLTIKLYREGKIKEPEYRALIKKYDSYLSEQKEKLSALNTSNMHPIFSQILKPFGIK